jgi:predicted PurR-regulated permease PerM
MKTMVLSAYLKLACIIIILIGGGYLVIIGEEILLPLSFAFLISLLLLPVCNFMENKLRFSRSIASIVAVVLLLISVCLIFYSIGSQIDDM